MAITFVNKATVTGGSVSSLAVTYAPTVGNALICGIFLESNNVNVSQVFDDAGIDTFGNPVNTWQNLGTVTLGSARMELWGCVPVNTPGTKVTVLLSGVQTVVDVAVLEYSGVASFGLSGSNSSTGYSNMFFVGTAENNTNVLVTMFGTASLVSGIVSGSGNVPPQNVPITPAVQRASMASGAGETSLFLEQATVYKDELIAEVVGQAIPSEGWMVIGVVLNGGLVLNPITGTAPGFCDINVNNIVAGVSGSPDPTKAVHALTLAQIAGNAALGMVRPEFFYGVYQNGDTVVAPVSPVDQYQYSRDELLYIYTQVTTFSPSSGWTSAAGILFYCKWDVDPTSGAVSSVEYYHPDGNTPVNLTNDGQLLVLTVAQRVQNGLVMSANPSLANVDLTLEGQDKPVTQTQLRVLAENSKFSAVKAEVFYMGEFVDGQTVPQPVSTVDGYVYNYNEVMFMSSWLWTSAPNAFGPPPMATASGGNAHGGWSQLQRMEANISSTGLVHCQVFFFNNFEIDPTQPANGGVAYGRLRVFALCQRNKGPYIGVPILDGPSFASSTTSFTVSLKGVTGSVTGNLSVSVPADASGNVVITKIVIKKALAGSNTIISTTTLSTGATVTAGTTYTTTPVSYTLDGAHDYYIVCVCSGHAQYTDMTGKLSASAVAQSWNQVPGDVSGSSTVSGLSLSPDTLWRTYSGITFTIAGDTAATGFADIPINALMPGQPLTAGTMTTLAKNVKTSAYAIEFFGPTTHVQGDTIPAPTSTVDGYVYSRAELLYIWQWRTTGQPARRLWGWGCTIGNNGLVNLMCWHVGDGGPVANITTGAQIDVITIGVRSQITSAQTSALSTNNGNPPTDLASLAIGGQGGFTVNGGS